MINTALFKEQLKRFWFLSVLIFVGFSLPAAVEVSLFGGYYGISTNLLVFVAPLIILVLFRFQNRINSATAMHSYPLTRNQLFATNILAGLVLLIVPVMVFFVILIPTTSSFSFLPGTVSQFDIAIRVLLSLLFFMTLNIFAASLSGNTMMSIKLSVILLSLPIVFSVLIIILGESVFGFYSHNHIHFMSISFFSGPLLFIFMLLTPGFGFLVASHFSAIIVAIIAAMAVCSAFVANKREIERVGDSIAFPGIKAILIFILSVYSSLLVGGVFFATFDNIFVKYAGFAFGFFAGYYITQMIVEKSFNILYKTKDIKKFGAVALGLLLLIMVSTRFGYERYVPNLRNIEGAQIATIQNFFIEPVPDKLLVKDVNIINEITAFHQTIIDERAVLRRFESNHSEAGKYMSILYKLINGNFIARTYYLPESFVDNDNVNRLLVKSRYMASLFQDRPDLISSITLTLSTPMDGVTPPAEPIVISKHDHIVEIIDSLMKDLDQLNSTNEFLPREIYSIQGRFDARESLGLASWDGVPGWFDRQLHHNWRSMLSFEIAHAERSHIYEWLSLNGYLS